MLAPMVDLQVRLFTIKLTLSNTDIPQVSLPWPTMPTAPQKPTSITPSVRSPKLPSQSQLTPPAILPLQGTIMLELSPHRVNVGSLPPNEIYNAANTAIQEICPFGSSHACIQKTSSFKVPLEVCARADRDARTTVQESIAVDIDHAFWGYNEAIYRLLVGSLAGAFERAAGVEANCYTFTEHLVGRDVVHRHCNSVDYAGVYLPGGYHMQVHFKGSSKTGEFQCARAVEPVGGYVETLKGEMEKEVGEAALDVGVRCM